MVSRLVGHTHDHIDQIFSHFAAKLGRKNVGILPSLTEIIRKTYSLEPVVLTLEETIDMCEDLLWDRMVK